MPVAEVIEAVSDETLVSVNACGRLHDHCTESMIWFIHGSSSVIFPVDVLRRRGAKHQPDQMAAFRWSSEEVVLPIFGCPIFLHHFFGTF
jgi:hypothetical protein